MSGTPTHSGQSASPAGSGRTDRLLFVLAGALGATALWAWCAGPLSMLRGGPALGDLVASGTEQTLLTVDGGGSDDVLVVLDQRAEELLVYRPSGGRGVEFRGRYALRALFAEARATGAIAPIPETPGTGAPATGTPNTGGTDPLPNPPR